VRRFVRRPARRRPPIIGASDDGAGSSEAACIRMRETAAAAPRKSRNDTKGPAMIDRIALPHVTRWDLDESDVDRRLRLVYDADVSRRLPERIAGLMQRIERMRPRLRGQNRGRRNPELIQGWRLGRAALSRGDLTDAEWQILKGFVAGRAPTGQARSRAPNDDIGTSSSAGKLARQFTG
jgi:hypothetical protein